MVRFKFEKVEDAKNSLKYKLTEEQRTIRSRQCKAAYRRQRDEFSRKHPTPRYEGSRGGKGDR